MSPVARHNPDSIRRQKGLRTSIKALINERRPVRGRLKSRRGRYPSAGSRNRTQAAGLSSSTRPNSVCYLGTEGYSTHSPGTSSVSIPRRRTSFHVSPCQSFARRYRSCSSSGRSTRTSLVSMCRHTTPTFKSVRVIEGSNHSERVDKTRQKASRVDARDRRVLFGIGVAAMTVYAARRLSTVGRCIDYSRGTDSQRGVAA